MLRHDLIDSAIQAHDTWLAQFGEDRVRNYGKLKGNVSPSGVSEGAACEALIGRYLRETLDDVQPYEKPSIASPDFRCIHKGKTFYVEVTSLDTKAVENASWIPDDPKWKGGSVGTIGGIVRSCVSGKVRQCHEVDGPTIVAVGVLHSWVSNDIDPSIAEDILISDVSYQIPLPFPNGRPRGKGEFVTGLRTALFMAASEDGAQAMRLPVSAVLLFGVGIGEKRIIGFVNPEALRPFDPKLMPDVVFAESIVEDNRPKMRWYNKAEGQDY